ncbi:MAG: major facilitator superfamily 1 [Nocardia sp.]|uniref:MFS transporter n=1 Tax=Nocardia sp. TaxID=1821 RepID=UPI002601D911|nr:MFS transporter [Nocardia sp.]MCU1646751.1 major facilitator superfamily 1 [Nocardia sp.]
MTIGLRPLLALATLARIPVTAITVGLALQVVLGLHRDYTAAGLVTATNTVGAAVSAPLFGYLVDRRGLRPVLVLTATAQALFWTTAPDLPYVALAVAAFAGGMFSLQTNIIVRQCIAAVVPEAKRSAAYTLDAVSTEIAIMLGPFLAGLVAATVSPHILMFAIGTGNVVATAAFAVLDPSMPTRSGDEIVVRPDSSSGREFPLPHWLPMWVTPPLLGVFVAGAATMIVLGGTEVAVIAAMRRADQVAATGVVFAAWSGFSIVGGLLAARLPRTPPARTMLALLALCTAPIGMAGVGWWQLSLALIPAGTLCAPTIGLLAADINRHAPPDRCGTVMGLYSGTCSAGLALGVLLAGSAVDADSPAAGFSSVAAAGLLVAVLVGFYSPAPSR